MTTPTREAIEARLKQVEGIRETWKGNPGYAATLDLDIYALRAALVLPKYIDHVRAHEGIDFLDRLNENSWVKSDVVFADEEVELLKPFASDID